MKMLLVAMLGLSLFVGGCTCSDQTPPAEEAAPAEGDTSMQEQGPEGSVEGDAGTVPPDDQGGFPPSEGVDEEAADTQEPSNQ